MRPSRLERTSADLGAYSFESGVQISPHGDTLPEFGTQSARRPFGLFALHTRILQCVGES